MKTLTNNLIGPALNWAVAKCEGRKMHFDSSGGGPWFSDAPGKLQLTTDYGSWEICGPIIEREKITTLYNREDGIWNASHPAIRPVKKGWKSGNTSLIAAMRCFVASKLGGEVDIPEELQ